MENKHLVSVIIPCFNSENFISRSLRSILHQSLPRENFEVIVINDGSTDRSKYLIEQFKGDVILIDNKQNKGLPYCLNQGINKAKGTYIARLDSDDFVNHHYLLFLLEYMIQHPEAKVCRCDYFKTYENGENREYKSSSDHPIGCGMIFEKEFILNIGAYNEQFLCHEDLEILKRIEKVTKIHHLPMPLYRYRSNPKSLTNNKNLNAYFLDKLKSQEVIK